MLAAASRRAAVIALLALGLVLLAGGAAQAQQAPDGLTPERLEQLGQPEGERDRRGGEVRVRDVPDVAIDVQSDDVALSRTVVIILLLTVGAVAPGLLLLMTTFTRYVIVLGITKNALALHTIPPAQVLVGLALFLTFFTMKPVLSEVNAQAIQPMLAGDISQSAAMEAGYAPLREFMLEQTRPSDLQMFTRLADAPPPRTPADVTATTLIPAFVVSELHTAFVIGFVIFMPFLVIDLVVAAILMALGMVMLPPVFVSLPVKLLVFVLVDGWALVIGSLVGSVNGIAS